MSLSMRRVIDPNHTRIVGSIPQRTMTRAPYIPVVAPRSLRFTYHTSTPAATSTTKGLNCIVDLKHNHHFETP